MLNVIHKYEVHFKEKPKIFDIIIKAFNKRTNANIYSSERLRYKAIKYSIIYETAKQENIHIGENFIEYHNKYYFKYADGSDGLLILFFCNFGFFNPRLFLSCIYCNSNNSRTHIVNECKENFL